jgi:hypothetical protein
VQGCASWHDKAVLLSSVEAEGVIEDWKRINSEIPPALYKVQGMALNLTWFRAHSEFALPDGPAILRKHGGISGLNYFPADAFSAQSRQRRDFRAGERLKFSHLTLTWRKVKESKKQGMIDFSPWIWYTF